MHQPRAQCGDSTQLGRHAAHLALQILRRLPCVNEGTRFPVIRAFLSPPLRRGRWHAKQRPFVSRRTHRRRVRRDARIIPGHRTRRGHT